MNIALGIIALFGWTLVVILWLAKRKADRLIDNLMNHVVFREKDGE